MSVRKRIARGHNQAELFGKSLGRALKIPMRRDLLFKRDTKDEQHNHTDAERRERVKSLFYVCFLSEESCPFSLVTAQTETMIRSAPAFLSIAAFVR